MLPLQVIDPEVHSLIAGGPELRRRFVDWIAFHVEQEHLDTWRRFRRILKQRNAALKAQASPSEIDSWNVEFAALGLRLDASRRAVLEMAKARLQATGVALLETDLQFDYQPGWPADYDLQEALERSIDRDRQLGGTQVGPHRGDIKVSYDDRAARKLVSRGQQKLLASAMILAATQTVQSETGRSLLLLLDDPAAELDESSVARLMACVTELGCQVVATSLDPASLPVPPDARMFHVEQGRIDRSPKNDRSLNLTYVKCRKLLTKE